MFVKAYNETREHGGINGLTPSEMFLQRLITSTIRTRTRQQSVTHVGNRKCNLSVQVQQLIRLRSHIEDKVVKDNKKI